MTARTQATADDAMTAIVNAGNDRVAVAYAGTLPMRTLRELADLVGLEVAEHPKRSVLIRRVVTEART